MADEQALAETTAAEETQAQPAEPQATEPAAAEPADTQRGDLSEALRQEREKRQALEASLSDRQFVYDQARKLGMTEEEAQDQAEQSAPTPAGGITYSDYEYFKSLDKSKEKYPSLAEDPDDQVAVTALMKAHKLSPLAAADRYYAKMNKVAEAAKLDGAKEKEATIAGKESAVTATTTAATTSEAAEYEEIVRRTRDYTNPKLAEKAQLELIKWKQAHR